MRRVLAFLLTAIFFSAYAKVPLGEQRNIVFDRLGTDDGLSQGFVTSFAQDLAGFIWIGTQEGLNRYDGFSFKHYYHSHEDSSSLSHDQIRALHVDSQGRVWIGTDEGLNIYVPLSDSFERISDQDGPHNSPIYSIIEDDDKQLWVGGTAGLFKVESDSDGLRLKRFSQKLGGVRALALKQGGESLWVGSITNGLLSLDTESGVAVRIHQDAQGAFVLNDAHVRAIVEEEPGVVWVATFDGGVSRYDSVNDQVLVFPVELENPRKLASSRTRSLLRDRDGHIWVGTELGLHLWDGSSSFHRFAHDMTNARSLSENTVHSLFQDDGGVIWVGTFDGVNKWNAAVEVFPYFNRPSRADDVAPSNNITSFAQDDGGNLWVGTFFGVMKWDADEGRLLSYSPSEIGLEDGRVMSLASVGDEIWVGTMSSGINRMAGTSVVSTFKSRTVDQTTIPANGITSFFEDASGAVWVTTFGGGVARYEGDETFTRFPAQLAGDNTFPELRCMDIIQVSEDEYWIATYGGGVVILKPSDGSIRSIRAENSPLLSDTILTLLKTDDGVYIGSESRGLTYVDFETNEFRNYTKESGLVSDAIYGMLADEMGNVWISGAKGLAMLDVQNETFSTYGTIHGLQSSDFNSGAFLKLQDRSLAFGGINGFNVFYPERIHRNEYVPPITLTSFSLFNEPYDLGGPVHSLQSIDLEYSDSVFSLGFASMDFTAPHLNKYRYMLEGFDRAWVEVSDQRSATYTNLDAGNYVFRVQGSNNDGVWNEEGASVRVVVHPAPWFTWWAYCIYAAVIAFLAYRIFTYNTERLQRAAERRYSERLQLYIESLEEASDCILIANSSGTLMYANNTITHGLNRTPSEVIGESMWSVLFEHEEDIEAAKQKLQGEGRYHGEVLLAGCNGSAVTHEVTIALVQQSSLNEKAYVGISRDITDRKVTEAELEDYRKNLEELVEQRTKALQKEIAENKAIQVHLADSLQEKELLIKEVHHRVKNNMQVISSLLSIQAQGAGDEIYSNLLNESQQRIKSMALIHETLYQSKDLLKIDFQEYIESLTTSLSRSYMVPGVSVLVDVNVQNVELDLETAVPCGLVINELVSNSLKHAFKGKEGTGLIDIDFVINQCDYKLRIADNGIGLPESFDLNKNTSMGMEIVSILTSQLEGELDAHNDEGAVFEISFPRAANG